MTRIHSYKWLSALSSVALAAALSACGLDVVTPPPANNAPTVSSTTPGNAATAVAVNTSFSVIFSEAMDPASLSGSSFTVTGPGTTSVSGAVTSVGVTALFKPSAPLAANTVYKATISVAAKSAAGVALAAAYSWQVTTGPTPDTTKPTVSSTVPASAATAVALDGNLVVTFSEAIDPTTISATTFTLLQGTTAVPGTVTASGVTATFNPTQPLAASTTYTATISAAKDLAGNALAASYGWTFTTGATADTTAPLVSSTVPLTGATGVATNSAITATFSEAMMASTINTATFTVTAPGPVAVAGTVTYMGVMGTFHPAAALANSTLFTATIATGAKDLAGNALAAAHTWTFTTGAAADTTPPTVASTLPLSAATGVLANASVKATFSEAMAPMSISTSTISLSGPAGAAVAGVVTFDAPTMVVTFQAGTALAANTSYVATIKGGVGGVTDLAGNALASDYTWSFTTGGAAGLAPVLLGTAGTFVILAKTAISTVPTSAVTGDIGVSPAAASFITGFGLVAATGYATSPQVVGNVYAADYAPPTPTNLTTAVGDMQLAYTDTAGRPTPDFLELGTGAIGGLTLTPGLYKWTSTVTIPSDITLSGNATDVWIFQISGDLSMSAAKNVTLLGGAKAKNVFWQVAGAVAIGTTAHFEGILLSQTSITLDTGASMNGRALAQTAVAIRQAALTQPAP